MFHLPHGRATGIALPYSLEFIASNPPLDHSPYPVERFGTAARFVCIDATTNQEGTQVFIQKIRDLERKVEESLSLKDAGITEAQMDKSMEALVSLAIKDPIMYTRPLASAAPKLLDTFLKTCGQSTCCVKSP